jgi:hypothetical protein
MRSRCDEELLAAKNTKENPQRTLRKPKQPKIFFAVESFVSIGKEIECDW